MLIYIGGVWAILVNARSIANRNTSRDEEASDDSHFPLRYYNNLFLFLRCFPLKT